jgi:S1-C subfamily serine protease
MPDRPIIPMGSDPNKGSHVGQATSPANPALPPQPLGTTLHDSRQTRWKKSLRSIPNRIRKNPAVWWPSILVCGLLILGLLSGQFRDEVASPREATTVPDNSVEIDDSLSEIDQFIVQSIVSIVVYEDGDACYSGSGSVVGDGTYVLTNQHVIASDDKCDVDEIRVQTVSSPGEVPRDQFTARVLAEQEDIDLALLSITPMKSSSPKLTPVKLSLKSGVGQDIVVVGFPAVGGESVTVSKGIISGFTYESGIKWIKTDAASSGGNSGGAAIDSRLRLIGVPTQFSQTTDGEVTDCRRAADTNGDGKIDESDTCVGIGATFTLMATAETAVQFAKSAGVVVATSVD